MKPLSTMVVIAGLVILAMVPPVFAETASIEEARRVSNGWISLITHLKGHWAGSTNAEVRDIQELKRGSEVLGYLSHVEPKGFIIVPLLKELAPVKAYSTLSDLEGESDVGLSDLFKGRMETILSALRKRVGRIETATSQQLQEALKINYRDLWDILESGSAGLKERTLGDRVELNYQSSKVLLAAEWNQDWPYNDQCPPLGCTDIRLNGRAWAGCTAVAGGLIMHYWSWPPYGVGAPYNDRYYDWPNMPDRLTAASSPAEIAAVAELLHEIGLSVHMDYGCDGSIAPIACLGCRALEDAFYEDFRYAETESKDRDDYDALGWFNLIKGELNKNRPMPYRIPGHSTVTDGWQEVSLGGQLVRQYHINYGHSDHKTTWYTVDEIYGGDPDEEYLLVDVYPGRTLFPPLSGTYPWLSFPYYYFAQDMSGGNASFSSGLLLQFLPGIKVTCTGAPGNPIRFNGSTSAHTRFFTRGDTSKGIVIRGGGIRLDPGGAVILDPLGKPRYLRASADTEFRHIALTWEVGHGNQEGFYVERSVSTPSNWSLVGTVGPNQTYFLDSNVTPLVQYFYRVRAFGNGNVSEYTRTIDVVPNW